MDSFLNTSPVQEMVRKHGKVLIKKYAKSVLAQARVRLLAGGSVSMDELVQLLCQKAERFLLPSILPVYNLSGIVLHTNLGRASLPDAAINAILDVARGASTVEYDLEIGKRGDRYRHVEALLTELTGAEGALVVNNNAAAVLLTLNTLAQRKEVPVSRGELVEIGGTFRMPDIMASAGCKLVEVGTTNRTHIGDFESVLGAKTALIMKVHTSNYVIEGFTKSVSERELAKIAHSHSLPMVTDLGSGSLVNLKTYELPYETTVQDALKAGADLVTFSGDKLLGGPQAGIIVGTKALIEKIKSNPMNRAMRPDKLSLAALQVVLRLYTNTDRLIEELPTLRLLARDQLEIEKMAYDLVNIVQKHLKKYSVTIAKTDSQVGSGALPASKLKSTALKITRPDLTRPGNTLNKLAEAFRELPVPVIGRIFDDALWFDLRCLEDEKGFVENLRGFRVA